MVVEEDKTLFYGTLNVLERLLPRLHEFCLIPLRFLEFRYFPVANKPQVDDVRCDRRGR